jgi:hypothetical protein
MYLFPYWMFSPPGNPQSPTYDLNLPAMMNAFIDFVGIIDQAAEPLGDHRLFAVKVVTYVGKDTNGPKYDTFIVACVLTP